MALVDKLMKQRADHKDLHFPPGYWPNLKAQCMACLWKQHCSFRKKPRTKCCTLPKHIWYLNHFWHCVLANWFNNVSIFLMLPVLIFIN